MYKFKKAFIMKIDFQLSIFFIDCTSRILHILVLEMFRLYFFILEAVKTIAICVLSLSKRTCKKCRLRRDCAAVQR